MSDALPACFRGTAEPPTSTTSSATFSNLTTCLYQTSLGLTSLTWSRNFFGHSLLIHLYLHHTIASFRLHLKPWLFWKKQGSKTFHLDHPKSAIHLSWDLSSAKFQSGPEPTSSFYIAIVVDGQMALLLGDSPHQAYLKTKAKTPTRPPSLIMRREHVLGNRCYSTKANFGGKTREISIECSSSSSTGEPRLSFTVDKKRVLQVKHLRWKFRGNERIEFEGVPVQVSWDVYNWLFDDVVDGHAVFMFRFEKKGFEEGDSVSVGGDLSSKGMVLWQPFGLEMEKGFERKKMKKSLLKTRSSSSSSSSASSRGSSSVMEWASNEESELQRSPGFSLLIYAWKR
ncbi:hypothetical protein MRB53_009107 [Persea americana]|uniref:Uncharacterized protein n=1 Tax=Persea americana TaxID=3435 RepID=A0ACC2LN79_PERAE|nr:hypothetical protein MRB53_009107 [Persea americana]|eukprot:TRINITY_DN13180_c2_g1_i1.p1 TRINITY_DN13180_c2_g1~~TRINITY_DN13180_c2_g1_i1.p1  ORF type:complete len:341 (+),score=68.48 TRINITY_DN13180_c2_g1_i1:880-1902(+)